MTRASLPDEVRSLLRSAISAFAGTPAEARLRQALERMDEPLRVAIAGRVKAGKSTLLNALVGQELAPTDAGECTKVVTWYRDGTTYRATLHPRGEEPRQVPFVQNGGPPVVELSPYRPEDVERLVIEWPSPTLRTATLIDTPGIASLSAAVAERTRAFLTPDEDRSTEADAVLYLMRHVHTSDVRFLEAFHDEDVAAATPVNAIGILSRADEIGAGRLDALESAARIVGHYRRDETLRRLCQTVIPVAGLVGQAGATLRESEFRALAAVAAEPAGEVDELLRSADRFARSEWPEDPPPAERAGLLGRLGLFGIRLSVDLIRRGETATSPALAAELIRRSGLIELRAELASRFADRSEVLRSRSALTTLEEEVRAARGPETERLAQELERVEAGGHELAELRLLNALRSGGIPLASAESEAAERLLGVHGNTPAARAGLPADAAPAAALDAIREQLIRWRRRSESPMSSREVVEAARILTRTCEGVLAEASPRPSPSGEDA